MARELIAALDEHIAGGLPLGELEAMLDEALQDPVFSPSPLLEALEARRAEAALPEASYTRLRSRIEARLTEEAELFADVQPPSHPPGAPDVEMPSLPEEETGFEPTRYAPGPHAVPPAATPTRGPAASAMAAGPTTESSWRVGPARELPSAETLGLGAVLKGRFVLEERLASGGMGVVYKARDLRKQEARDPNPYIAIKVLGEDFSRYPDAFIALQREAKKAQSLAHPNVVTVFDFDRDENRAFMTMELLEGESLGDLLKRLPPGGLPLRQAIPLIEGMAKALEYAHRRGIVHSDFKPSNVFMTADGVVKVLDFGIARALKRPGHEQEVTVFDPARLGALTPPYASCEMLEGQAPDPRDDIYGLACVTYEILSGRHPFNKVTATQARDNRLLPERVRQLSRRQWRGLARGLALGRAERTPTVTQFLEEVLVAPTLSRVAAVGIGILALLALGGGVVWYIQDQQRQQELASAQRQAVEAERQRVAEEQQARGTAAEEEHARRQAQELERQRAAEEQARRTAAEEEQARRQAQELERQRAAEEQARRTAAEEEYARRQARELERQRAAEEQARLEKERQARIAARGPLPEGGAVFSPQVLLDEVYARRDRAVQVEVRLDRSRAVIGQDAIRFHVRASRGGFLYVLMAGTDDSLYLLFPNALDMNNRISADGEMTLPRPEWTVTAEGPPGTDRLLAILSETPRDFSAVGLRPGHPFGEFSPDIGREIAHRGSFEAYAGRPQCAQGSQTACPEGFGAARFDIQESLP